MHQNVKSYKFREARKPVKLVIRWLDRTIKAPGAVLGCLEHRNHVKFRGKSALYKSQQFINCRQPKMLLGSETTQTG
jgi:hypothetical protein